MVPDYIVVDDFESYNDLNVGTEGSRRIYLTWIDGYDNPSANGSTMGYPEPDFAEGEHFVDTEIVHGGGQSAPLFFDNSTAQVSEVTVNPAELSIGNDWTIGTPEKISLWVYGDSGNPATEQMFVRINNSKVVCDVDLTNEAWQEVVIDLADFNVGLGNVTTLGIGLERTATSGGTGMIFFDDVRLYE
jgi:hypothetical protein